MDRLYSSSFYGLPAAGAIPSGYNGYGVIGQGSVPQSLQKFPAYRQADWRGKQRMEQMAAMGLPINTDPSRVRKETALSLAMGRPISSTTMPQPWGTWGAFGSREEIPVSTSNISRVSQKRESTKEEAPEGYLRNRFGYLEKDYGKEGYTRNRYGYWEKNPNQQPNYSEVPQMPEQNQSWRMSLLGSGPTLGFPQQNFSYL
jgi:hypothetical protein